MATIDCVIDTEPMARSIDSVRAHVDATTAAVVAMQAATIAAERDAANAVCRRVDAGFHALILSQISQRAARAKAVVDSKLAQLVQLGEFLHRLQGQMEMDFHRIKARYHQLFRTLDQTLAQRVSDLDRGVFDMASTQSRRLAQRTTSLAIAPIAHQRESLPLSQAVSMARTRTSTRAMIRAAGSIIDRGESLRQSIETLKRPGHRAERQPVAVPVLFAAFDVVPGVPVGRRVEAPPFLPMNSTELSPLPARIASATTRPVGPEDRLRIARRAEERLTTQALPPRVLAMAQTLLARQQWAVPAEPSAS